MDTTKGVAAAAVTAVATVAAAVAVGGLLRLVLRAWLALARGRGGASTSGRPSSVPPGPPAFPVIGSLYAMRGNGATPFRRFSELAAQYGPVYSMAMGSTRCVVVSDYASIKEVLITKGSLFGGRPDFIRYNVLFAGDRNNSLALCDCSWLQEARRKIARKYCSPKTTSFNYALLDTIASDELENFLELLNTKIENDKVEEEVQVKPLLLMACANMFFQFMCSTRFEYEDKELQNIVRIFDEIFWDINQGYAVDFLPWLRLFYTNHMNKLSNYAKKIRSFIMEKIITNRETYKILVAGLGKNNQSLYNNDELIEDFTDSLLVCASEDERLSTDHILFMLEDFLGGHTAVANMILLALSLVAQNPNVVEAIRKEIDEVTNGNRFVRLFDKPNMPFTEAVQYETMRILTSPIVPHVATEDTTIRGYKIAKGTCIILNNYILNTSSEYWKEPKKFDPSRFIKFKPDGTPFFRKPEHFIPFSTGKRTCIGQKLVIGFGHVFIAGILKKYDVKTTDQVVIPEACLALPPDSYGLIFKKRDEFK